MRHLGWLALAVCLTGALALTACTGTGTAENSESNGSQKGTDAKPAFKVGIVFDKGGIGDKSFNDSAWRGIEKATKDFQIDAKKVESKEEKDYETNLTAMADQGLDLVIAVGINQGKALEKVCKEYPDQKFAIVDGFVEAPNVRILSFNEEQGSFLVGYLAGLMTKTNKLGFVGGMELDLIKKFQYGFAAGAKTANKDAEVLPAKYTGNWDNIDSAKAAGTVLYDCGADIIYHAAGRAGLGVIRLAGERKLYAIGVDSDQDGEAEGYVLTSMIKRVDEAVYATIKDCTEGKFTAGQKVYDLAANGVGISELRFTKDKIGADNLAKLDEVRANIVSGKIKCPVNESEYDAYIATLK